MKKPSDPPKSWDEEREKIIGLGERSVRKTYYPELQRKLDELERFRALLDQSNDCIFLMRIPSLAFIDVNESACRQLECTRQAFLSFSLEDIFPGEAATKVRELVAFGHAEGKDQDTITTRLHKCSGGGLPVEMTIRLVVFNREIYGVAVARDITERKRTEKVLLENSLLRRDMQLARQIQLSLLPAGPPELAGAVIAGLCIPAAHVGGDYFDYYRHEDWAVDLVIADVSGHSIGAALMMVEARSVLRARVRSYAGTGEILASLNDLLYADLSQSGLFITFFYVRYHPSTRTLVYANAGHVPPLLFRPSEGSCRKLDAEGLVVGIKEGVAFEEKQLRIGEGDVLLLYTDGITETENSAGELFGAERLCAVVGANAAGSPQEVIDAVLREVAAFREGAVQEDDVAMIALKVV
jgi:sigma-B regulation protein RsbU (phosphoserine phosphatase)